MSEPRELILQLERAPTHREEGVVGYGIPGLPFRSGHVLGFCRCPALSEGEALTGVWHRTPDGRWTLWADREADWLGQVTVTEIHVEWDGPRHFYVRVGTAMLEWTIRLRGGLTSRLSRWLLPRLRHRALAFEALGPLLGLGHLRLQGRRPNGRRIALFPSALWFVDESGAMLGTEALGLPGPPKTQIQLAELWLPQRGVFVVGDAFFGPSALPLGGS